MHRTQREADLIAYYDNEIGQRAVRELPQARVLRRAEYLELLRREGITDLLEIGCGPGRDGIAFADAGLAYTGVDLAPQSVATARSLGLDARQASVLQLPFEDASFGAGWTMSTLLHIADIDLDAALTEILRVLRPGAPLAIGLWGDEQASEQLRDNGSGHGPARFFSIRTDAALQAVLQRHGTLEQWLTWPGTDNWHYQWAILRRE
ncbi:class I SAM-dependent methyltransferase [Nocardia brasiliensis]|uniref:class I SAM-dependent methyltransferase n=1 Tax=Nocardia brasiliensis TaxID=37326 RepID=UPI0018931618|nr:class I SAM-dependent methyltransferase [Nocardia brasiliensis]MBF6130706.1 class I SAM-dependent methyltransferase [Nocardia brasiliensis]